MIQAREEFEDLKKFGESFDHTIPDDVAHPIYTIERGDQMIGYFNVMTYPIVSPALHPRICTPRDFYEAIHILKNHYCLITINQKLRYGTGLMALPSVPVMDMKVVEKAGFKNTRKEIWQATPT